MRNHTCGKKHRRLIRPKLAKSIWGPELTQRQLTALRDLVEKFGFSPASGEISLLNGNWYVTHSGLVALAQRRRCQGIGTTLLRPVSDPNANRWVFRATVYKKPGSRSFVGYGDADPSNISPLMHGAEMRIAETRAVNRALRKAYGIGLCSVEELGWSPKSNDTVPSGRVQPLGTNGNGHHKGSQPRLRDQLCLLIRQYNLIPIW